MHRICIIYNVLFISDIQRTALDLKIRPRWGNNPCTYFIIIQEEASLPNVYPKVRKRKMAKLKKWQIKWSTNWASFQRKMLQSHQKGSNSQFSVCRCGSVWNINLLIKKRGWSVSTNSSVLWNLIPGCFMEAVGANFRPPSLLWRVRCLRNETSL